MAYRIKMEKANKEAKFNKCTLLRQKKIKKKGKHVNEKNQKTIALGFEILLNIKTHYELLQ